LVERSDTHATLSFIPDLKALAEDQAQLRGQVVLNTEIALVEQIRFENTEKLSPAFFVTLSSYEMTLSLSSQQGQMLLQSMTSKLAGKAGFFMTFKSQVKIEFSEYQYVGVENAEGQ
jgi:hypothetical protein